MPDTESMNGRYYRTCANDITSSPGWFKNILLLGLVQLVPVFGSMTVDGYAFEWGHKAAWRFRSPMPYKIYGRRNSRMLWWGWFALVIALVFSIVPELVNWLGDALAGASGTNLSFYSHSSRSLGLESALGISMGSFLQFVALVGLVLAEMLAWVGSIRMTMYNSLGAGLQFKRVWKMATHDFGGLLRIFGMELVVTLVIALLSLLVFAITLLGGGMTAVLAALGSGAATGGGSFGLGVTRYELVMVMLSILPLLIVDCYIVSCMVVYCRLLVGRAVGYWCAQFDVAQWGTRDDPLPFERGPAAASNRQSERPAAPEGEEAPASADADAQAGSPDSNPDPQADEPEADHETGDPEPEAGEPEADEPEPEAEPESREADDQNS